ncbi:hypothetical protein [Gordonia rubripertincta]|uniref:hypothetical protein n=1 Tax=Gordonia rubripertincta TaxID=36822 RepID=UPI0015FDFB8D|nr:hypothetical protein [Gordonia rubripertincta]QMU22493.1 hypothetical protein H3V45_08510 [Gordonia rubripertincta]
MTFEQLLGELARGLGWTGFGLMLGLAVTWRKKTVHGYEVPVPTPRPDGVIWRRLIGGILVVTAVLSVVNGAMFTSRQANCNEEFRRVIKERSDDSVTQSELWSQLERKLADIGPAVTLAKQQQIVDARKSYVTQYEAITEKRRANPYPDPRC